ncbi:BQ5605_C004g02607 [Microbotryum silenes-dioicae]|uniref:BQ5605_C004g02607 protein n=1 Tax=Microbotryum silenes-dioicae TaxID=796604 RepID=A0A2X0MCF4_9BASI|nr:BQ5605_C004g02607 [Microbotryum silenes-dioicae]
MASRRPSKTPPRQDIEIPFGAARMSAWFYPSPIATTDKPGPCVVIGHGLGAFKLMRLDAYAETFQKAGYSALAFDYRGFGESTGSPRQILDWNAQQEDWKVVLEYTRTEFDQVGKFSIEVIRAVDFGTSVGYDPDSKDPERIAIFGTSFGGGESKLHKYIENFRLTSSASSTAHAITAASKDKRIKAAISQCPFTSGFHSSLTVDWKTLPWVLFAATKDVLFGTKESYTPIKVAGYPGEPALMNAPDAMTGFNRFVSKDYRAQHPDREYVAARIVFQMPFLYPGRDAKRVQCPIYFAICKNDSVAPPGATMRYAKQAPRGEIKEYGAGHFEIYFDEHFEEATKDYVDFLHRHLPPN